MPDAIAPDGSEVRLLCSTATGSMANFQLPPGAVSVAHRHLTVSELWYIVSGFGQLWLHDGEHDEVIDLECGVSVEIPVGCVFQFRAAETSTLSIVGVTMPPWPTERVEAVPADIQKWRLR